MTVPEWIVAAVGVYAVLGLPVAIVFLLAAPRIDHRFGVSPFRVRILMIPGVIAMWPLVVARLIHAGREVSP